MYFLETTSGTKHPAPSITSSSPSGQNHQIFLVHILRQTVSSHGGCHASGWKYDTHDGVCLRKAKWALQYLIVTSYKYNYSIIQKTFQCSTPPSSIHLVQQKLNHTGIRTHKFQIAHPSVDKTPMPRHKVRRRTMIT